MNITERLFLEDPELKDVIPARFKSHKKIYEDAVRKGCLVLKKVRELQESGKGDMDMFTYVFFLLVIKKSLFIISSCLNKLEKRIWNVIQL